MEKLLTVESEFLRFSVHKLRQCLERIESCVGRLTPEQIWARGSENQNAVGNLFLHLNGNVRQWILSGVAGRPGDRQRRAEFAARGGAAPPELLANLKSTVEAAVEVLSALPPERLLQRLEVQGFYVTGLEAIYHVVEHFVGHTFQIIFVTKLLTGEDLGFYGHLAQTGRASSGTKP